MLVEIEKKLISALFRGFFKFFLHKEADLIVIRLKITLDLTSNFTHFEQIHINHYYIPRKLDIESAKN